MLKIYEAKSQVSMNVNLPGGGYVHVSFTSKTGGGSVFYTHDETLQNALERHSYFGRLFRLQKTVDPAEEAKKVAPVMQEEKSKNSLEFKNNDDAKEYFAEKYGYSRSRLRSRAAIEEAARKYGVEITWKE